jgi:hypothetical protein
MELEFKILSMMELRSSPGDILDRVYKDGEAFIIERSGQQKACLVPIYHFFPDIPKSKIHGELDELRVKGEEPILKISDKLELEIAFKKIMKNIEVTIKIILPHGYPNVAPKVYAYPIRSDAPHRWQDGALCIFGAMTTWNPGKGNLAYILNLAKEWLSHYEVWNETGTWPLKEGDGL